MKGLYSICVLWLHRELIQSDRLPQVTSLEPVSVGSEDYKFGNRNNKTSEGVELERSELGRPVAQLVLSIVSQAVVLKECSALLKVLFGEI